MSDGAASIHGLLGRTLDQDRTRWFMTQQHGMNQVWEFVVAEDHGERGEHRK